jgi:hypothetical protein
MIPMSYHHDRLRRRWQRQMQSWDRRFGTAGEYEVEEGAAHPRLSLQEELMEKHR